MVRLIVLCLLFAIVAACQILQPQVVQQAEAQKTFAELSQAEKYTYLSAVLKAQREVIRSARIARIKSLTEELTHKVDLTVQLIDDGFERTKLIRVSWSKVQADSVELLRCKLQDLTTSATVEPDADVVKAGYDFDKLQAEPKSYGFLECVRVYGRIQNGVSLIDHGAENGFKYVYFFLPCYKNYAVVAPATADTDTKQCGKDKIAAAENSQASLATADKHTLVFRYCQTDAQQVCSSTVSHNRDNPIAFNQGKKELPLHLFEELRALRAEIEKHEDALYKEGNEVLDELSKSGPCDRVCMLAAQLDKLESLQEDHAAANAWRAEKQESITRYTGWINQSMAKYMGHEMSFRGQDCYGAYKQVEKEFDGVEKELAEIEEMITQPGDEDVSMDHPVLLEDTEEDTEMADMEMIAKGFVVGGCLINNGITAGKLVNIKGLNPFKDEKFKISKNIEELNQAVAWDESINPRGAIGTGAKFGKAEWGLAVANFAVDMIPLETSELNRGGGIAAFSAALDNILISEDSYTRDYCQPCLDHMAQVKFHSRKIYYLQQRLLILNEQIKKELLEKGAVDPNAP